MPSWLVAFRTIMSASGRRWVGLRSDAGFTLIEALAAAVILIVGLIALLGLLDASVKASAKTRAREGAVGLAREIIEDARTIPYAQIVPESIKEELRKIEAEGEHPLAGASSSPWQIDRRGFVYTLEVEECAVDDPKDGLATTHKLASEGGTFCEGQENWKEGTIDTEPEDLKHIAAKVSWTFQKHTSTVTQVSTLTAAGQAVGLTARELKLKEPTGFLGTETEPVIAKAVTELTFSVAFPEGTSAIDWSLEGAKQGEISSLTKATSPTTFKWTISGVSDGTYQVSAQAVNSTGVIGPPISIPVRLIRGEPAKPEKVVGGFNNIDAKGVFPTEVVELDWKANTERDVIGYRVRGPKEELVCPENLETLSVATSCIDFAPVEGTYTVVALYRNASENKVTESKNVALEPVTHAESTAPELPATLVAEMKSNGSVTLKWTASSGASFYRIYRGSQEYTSRYGETTETVFTDTEASTTHEYWVTAVGPHLTESKFSNEATG